MYIKIAIRIEIMAIDKFERRNLSKKQGINNFMVPPNKIIGIVPIKIDRNKRSWRRYLNNIFEFSLLKLYKSFLKYQIKANTLPI